jgi:hypothetical protein
VCGGFSTRAGEKLPPRDRAASRVWAVCAVAPLPPLKGSRLASSPLGGAIAPEMPSRVVQSAHTLVAPWEQDSPACGHTLVTARVRTVCPVITGAYRGPAWHMAAAPQRGGSGPHVAQRATAEETQTALPSARVRHGVWVPPRGSVPTRRNLSRLTRGLEEDTQRALRGGYRDRVGMAEQCLQG